MGSVIFDISMSLDGFIAADGMTVDEGPWASSAARCCTTGHSAATIGTARWLRTRRLVARRRHRGKAHVRRLG